MRFTTFYLQASREERKGGRNTAKSEKLKSMGTSVPEMGKN